MPRKKKSETIKSVETNQSNYIPQPNMKDIAVKKLREAGIQAYNDNGVVIGTYRNPEESIVVINRMNELLQEIGYDGSFGIRSVSKMPGMLKQEPEIEEIDR